MRLMEWVACIVTVIGAAGVWLIVTGMTRRRGLSQRLAPWIADVSVAAAHEVTQSVRESSISLRRRLVSRLAGVLARVWMPGASLAVKARRAGIALSMDEWRVLLVEASLVGAVLGAVLGVVAAAVTAAAWLVIGALVILGAVSGVLFRQKRLQQLANRRVALMRNELPAVAELLALSVTAGESFVSALNRVSAHGSGPLAHELRAVVARVNRGGGVAESLADLTRALDVPELTRTFDHVIAALDRGAPLAQSLRTQAAEARAETARRIQERAATREVAMLVPLIFLILPVTIAFAIFPGLIALQSGF